MRFADKRRELAATTDPKKVFQVQARRIMETAAKKIKIVKPGDNVMVPVPDLGRAKIGAHSLRHRQAGDKVLSNSCWE